MKIKKIKSQGEYCYPATIAAAVKDANFLKEDNSPMTLGEINLYLNSTIENNIYKGTVLSDNVVISKIGKPTGLNIGTKLGMLYRNDEIYQFSSSAKCAVIDLKTLAVKRTFDMPVSSHFGSNEWLDIENKIMFSANDSSPLCIYILDINDEANITYRTIDTSSIGNTYFNGGMQLICYDNENKIMYVSGYKKDDTNKDTIVVTKLDFSDIVTNNGTEFTLLDTFEIPGMHILDGAFYNGYLFMAVDSLISGLNPGGNNYDASAVVVVDVINKLIYKIYNIKIKELVGNTYPETQGCAIDTVRNKIYVANLYGGYTFWELDFSPEVNKLREDIDTKLGDINTILTNILG